LLNALQLLEEIFTYRYMPQAYRYMPSNERLDIGTGEYNQLVSRE